MAVTIVRTNWIDDDGTGTTGTVINNAVKTALYNDIDGGFAKVAQLAGGNSFTGNQAIAGVLTVSGFGAHLFSAGGTGGNLIGVVNTAATAANYAQVYVANDAGAVGFLRMLSSGTGPSGYAFANGGVVGGTGAGGISIAADNPTGAIRCYTGGATERLRILPTGELLINATANPAQGRLAVAGDGSVGQVITTQNLNAANTGYFLYCVSSAAAGCGGVAQASGTTVTFQTSSDQRLKIDEGRASDVSALRAVVVHDFTWTADGVRDRGVFAQEAHALYPRAVQPGTDDRTEQGDLQHPWMTDYSKFVPDLIVGWQQHDADLAELRALLVTLKGSADAE